MKRWMLGVLVGVLVGLAVTNPPRIAAVNAALRVAGADRAPKDVYDEIGRGLVYQMFMQNSERVNLGIASVTSVTAGSETRRFLGIAGHVFPL